MRRREFMLLLSGLMTAARTTGAQQTAVRLIAVLPPRTFEGNTSAFRRGLRELGYLEGQNVALEVRSARATIGGFRRSQPNPPRSNGRNRHQQFPAVREVCGQDPQGRNTR